MTRFVASCDAKKEDDQWEGIGEKYKKVQKLVYDTFFKDKTLVIIARMFTQTLVVQDSMGLEIIQTICEGATASVKAIGHFFSLWNKYGEKLEMGKLESYSKEQEQELRDLRAPMIDLHRHFCWFLGHLAYNFIRIDPVVDNLSKMKDEELNDEQKRDKQLT